MSSVTGTPRSLPPWVARPVGRSPHCALATSQMKNSDEFATGCKKCLRKQTPYKFSLSGRRGFAQLRAAIAFAAARYRGLLSAGMQAGSRTA